VGELSIDAFMQRMERCRRQVRNAYDPARNPSGSSAGSGVAAAASFCAAAIGTETNGSILSPSSINGLVGFKPTVGVVSGKGVVPIRRARTRPARCAAPWGMQQFLPR